MINWFTSDTHYFHPNIILYCNRPWSNKEYVLNNKWKNKVVARMQANTMTTDLIKYHNELVQPADTVYHLGDFSFRGVEEVVWLLRMLNGNFKFIWGNHDKSLREFKEEIYSYPDQYPDLKDKVEVEGQKIVLNHYALRTWRNQHRGSWSLYGHSHGTLADDPNSLSFDVGIDCHDYRPIPFNKVKQIMSKKIFKPIDHHKGKNALI